MNRLSLSYPTHFRRNALLAGWLLASACSSATSTQGTEDPSPSQTTTPSPSPGPDTTGFEVLESEVQRASTNPSSSIKSTLARDNWNFALDLHEALAGEENLFYSPYSITTAMAMAYVGSRNNTKTELAGALHYTLSDAELHSAFNHLDATLGERDVAATEGNIGLTLTTNNDIWAHINPDLRPTQDYVDALAANYSAPVRLVDFDDELAARTAINAEVSRQTKGTVDDLIPEGVIQPHHTVMVLTNTIYMKAAWQRPFEKPMTQTASFTNLDETTSDVDMMHSMESLEYFASEDFQAVRLPYVGGDVAMTVILPKAGQFLTVEAALSAETTQELAFTHTPVDLRLPKFELSSAFSVKQALLTLGAHDAFDPAAADFTGIRPGALYIQDVLHQAFISVDEVGTEAGAATAVVFGDESAVEQPDIEFHANRPFIVLLQDIPTSTLLFAGRVVSL